jgi:ribosomal protein S18 acetylase RimI-like enzyme
LAHVSDYYKEQLASKDTIYYLALIENQVVGFISVKLHNRSPIFKKSLIGRIDTLIVTGKNRRSGIGTQLYDLAKKWLKNQGINTVQTSVASNNPTGIEFCKNIGFEELMIRMEKQI